MIWNLFVCLSGIGTGVAVTVVSILITSVSIFMLWFIFKRTRSSPTVTRQEPVYEEVIPNTVEERVVLKPNACYSQTQGAVAQSHDPDYDVIIDTKLNDAYGKARNLNLLQNVGTVGMQNQNVS